MTRQPSGYLRQRAEMLFSIPPSQPMPESFSSEGVAEGGANAGLFDDLKPIQQRIRSGIRNFSRQISTNSSPTAVWHAYASRSDLNAGTEILVTGGRAPVRIRVNDQISLDTPNHGRRLFKVTDRRGVHLILSDERGGRRVLVASQPNMLKGFTLSDGFSREGWIFK